MRAVFRGRHSGAMRKHRTRNLEILGCAIAHPRSRSARTGMTFEFEAAGRGGKSGTGSDVVA
jgi:hypothetical protein